MITTKNLTFSYPGQPKPAIAGLTFEIDKGEVFGFLGPSGAGKSTTQKILVRLLRHYQGTVSVFGRDLNDWGPDYFERVGVSFEFPTHFLKLTAIENLKYFARLYRSPAQSPTTLLELVDLGEDGRMPVSQYSKGMKNRLSVARALLHDPELLFLDEPTAGLDPINARRIKELIKVQKAEGKTVILTTHDMTLADELCDRVALIAQGRIRVVDSPRVLKLRYGQPRLRVGYRAAHGVEHREFPLIGLGDNTEFLSLLRENNIETVHSAEASLEDVFIQTTGFALQ
jgi:fluoroquinolone transport system ATP-binding protein